MRKTIFIVLALLVVTICLTALVVSNATKRHIDEQATSVDFFRRIGKTYVIQITEHTSADGNALRDGKYDFDLWDHVEREKMAKYMLSHHLKVKAGRYAWHQGYTYEDGLAVLSFVPADNYFRTKNDGGVMP